ncbi:MAG: MFS transporter [Syntrophomonadaceae bacterium]
MAITAKWQVLIIISIGIFMSTLDGSILNIANPTIAGALKVNMSQVQWVVTSYMLVITSSLLFFGRLGDKVGSEKVYSWGFLVFGLGSLVCSLSHSLGFLIFARIIQAFGASMMMATGIGIVSNTFPSTERGKALGLTGSMVGIGNMVGPSLGGVLVANFPWQVIFLINIPIGVISFLLAKKYLIPQPQDSTIKGYDTAGISLFALAAAALILSLTGDEGINIYLFVLAITMVIVFYIYEKNTRCPMLDFSLFKSTIFLRGNLMASAVYTTQMSVFFLLPFCMERLYHLSPSESGLFLTIPPVTMAITAPLAGTLSDKLGSARIVSTALALLTTAYLILSTLGPQMDNLKVICGLIFLGLGMGMFGSPNNSSIFGSLPKEKAGYAGGFVSTVRNLCFSLGIALSVSIFTYLYSINQKHLSVALSYVQANSSVYRLAAVTTFLALLLSALNKKMVPGRAFQKDISA